VQSVALHEMGHTIGLGDLYGKPAYSGDTDQVMHYYTGVKHELGVGDRTGAQKLYGGSAGSWLSGDFNGDGKTDLIQMTGSDYVNLWTSNGDGSFDIKAFSPGTGYGTSIGKWEVSDANGDGKADLTHIVGGDYINTWISKGDGTFQIKSFQPWPGYGTSLGGWKVGDINGDGKADLEHIWGGDYINTWISKGDGTYQMNSFQPSPGYGTSLGRWKAADIDGDGKSDLEHIWGGDYINTWISKGDGTYQMKSFQPSPGYGTSLGQWEVGDINGDGKADLEHIWGGDYINTWMSKGDGTYQIKSFSPSSGYSTNVGTWCEGDVDGDGKKDLIHLLGGDIVYTWISNGDGSFNIRTTQ
jgi:hypothetical protein